MLCTRRGLAGVDSLGLRTQVLRREVLRARRRDGGVSVLVTKKPPHYNHCICENTRKEPTMSLPGFTAGKSIYQTRGAYRMGSALQAAGLVQPAQPPGFCCPRCLTECGDNSEACLSQCSRTCGLPCGLSHCGPCRCTLQCAQQCCDNAGNCGSQSCGSPFPF